MNKITKIVLIVIMAILLAATLTACGSGDYTPERAPDPSADNGKAKTPAIIQPLLQTAIGQRPPRV